MRETSRLAAAARLAPFLPASAEPGGHEANWRMGTLGMPCLTAQPPPMLMTIPLVIPGAGDATGG